MAYVVRLFRARSELRGTLYIEFQPGVYADEHWRPGSVFVREEFWADLERIVHRREPGYGDWGHYGVTPITAANWSGILADFDDLAIKLKSADREEAVALLPSLLREYEPFQGPGRRAVALRYAMLARDLSKWVRRTLETHDTATILGI